MPTITIDLPDNANVPSDWDAQMFFVTKMYEAGFIPSDCESVKDSVPVNTESESWFTPEEHAQFRANRRRLEEEAAKNPPRISREEYHQILLNGPVADEEEIQALEEIQQMRRQWVSPW